MPLDRTDPTARLRAARPTPIVGLTTLVGTVAARVALCRTQFRA